MDQIGEDGILDSKVYRQGRGNYIFLRLCINDYGDNKELVEIYKLVYNRANTLDSKKINLHNTK